eukprot:7383507-Prymnesium_polylepis.1
MERDAINPHTERAVVVPKIGEASSTGMLQLEESKERSLTLGEAAAASIRRTMAERQIADLTAELAAVREERDSLSSQLAASSAAAARIARHDEITASFMAHKEALEYAQAALLQVQRLLRSAPARHSPSFCCRCDEALTAIAAHGGAGSVNVSTLAEIATRAANAAAAVMTDPANCGPLSWRSESWRDESWRDSLRESMRDDAPPAPPSAVVALSPPDEPPVEEAAGVLGRMQARRPSSAGVSPFAPLTDEPTAEEAAGVLGRRH